MSRLVSLALFRRRGVAAVSASAGIASADVVDGRNSSSIGRNAADRLADDFDDAASSQDLIRLGSVCSLRAGVAAGRPRAVADGRRAAADDEDEEDDDDNDEENRSRASSASNRAHSAAVLGVGRNRCWTYLAWIQAVSSLVDRKTTEKTKKRQRKK
jgi:hypothetical protein